MQLADLLAVVPPEKRAWIRAEWARLNATPGSPAAIRLANAQRDADRRAAEETRRDFQRWCVANGLPAPVPEFRFCEKRYRMDYAWPAQRVYLEVDGAIWTQGRHTRGAGWQGDTRKFNRASELGWRLLRCTPDTLTSAETLDALRAALSPAPEQP